MNVAVTVRRFSFAHPHRLMPAMHSGNWIGMNREGQVLVHADIVPPDSQSIGIAGFVWFGAALALQSPLVAFMVESHGRPQLFLSVLMNLPVSQRMPTG